MNWDALHDRQPLKPFSPGARVPWDEPAFSARMLREHLDPSHDRASRRLEVIDRQVSWLQHAVLGGADSHILDLGCGPGLYTSRLARAGHRCVGIDFSPAAIAYAEEESAREGLACRYVQADLADATLGEGYDLITMLFGEFNTLPPAVAQDLLSRAAQALAPNGQIVLELHAAEYVEAMGEAPSTWSTADRGLFADDPHLTLHESHWHAEEHATTERYWVLQAHGPLATYAISTQAYGDLALDRLLERSGLRESARYPSITGDEEEAADLFGVVLTRD